VLETGEALIRSSAALAGDAGATLGRLLAGFVMGSVLGVLIGTCFGLSKRLYELFEIVVDFFRSLPIITLYPITMIAFGMGNPSKIALTTLTVFLLTVVNTMYGIRQVPHIRLLAARTLGARGWPLFWKVLIPSAIPTIVVGLRLSVSLGLIVVVMTEMFTGTGRGLGKQIYNAGLVYEIPTMYAAIVVTGILGFALNKIIMSLESRISHWSGK
jgi:NitT/TauT family transport system permease protein